MLFGDRKSSLFSLFRNLQENIETFEHDEKYKSDSKYQNLSPTHAPE